MKAVQIYEYGPASNLKYEEVPMPEPAPNEVLIKVEATSLNPVDWKLRSGQYKSFMPLQFPVILGHDAAGVIVKAGASVSSFEVGQRVMGMMSHTHAEYVTAPAPILVPVSAQIDSVQAAALPVVVTTGAQLIEKAIGLKPGDTILITGALGNVGRTAVFVAKQHGANVIAGVRGKQKAEAVRLGADQIIAIDDDQEISSLPELDAIGDTVGGAVVDKLIPAIKKGGVLGTVLSRSALAEREGVRVSPFSAQPDAKQLAAMAEAVRKGELVIAVEETFPLQEVSRAHERGEKGGVQGKLVLIP